MIYCTPAEGFWFGLFEGIGILIVVGSALAYAYWRFKD